MVVENGYQSTNRRLLCDQPPRHSSGFAYLQCEDEVAERRDEGLNMGDTHTRRNGEREIRVLTITKGMKGR